MTSNQGTGVALAILSGLLLLVAAALVLLRLFGFLFFASSTSFWALVPAIVLGLLIGSSVRSFPGRRAVSIGLILLYLASLYSYEWERLSNRVANGQSLVQDVVEIALIVTLFARSAILGQAGMGARSQ